ncbi:hypothetical protein JDF658_00010 [Carboxydocella sp. JDF658]|nr:hypothetical protein JDF658_00010 [Carboxydocella sp. JDF658]
MKTYPHVYLDTSWVLGNPRVQVALPTLAQFMEKYPHRFLYGSDFPIMEYAPQAGLQTLLTLGLSESTLDCILRENARQLLEE